MEQRRLEEESRKKQEELEQERQVHAGILSSCCTLAFDVVNIITCPTYKNASRYRATVFCRCVAAQSGADAHLERTAADERLHDRETPAEREG